jgi:YD repeat-containing protein
MHRIIFNVVGTGSEPGGNYTLTVAGVSVRGFAVNSTRQFEHTSTQQLRRPGTKAGSDTARKSRGAIGHRDGHHSCSGGNLRLNGGMKLGLVKSIPAACAACAAAAMSVAAFAQDVPDPPAAITPLKSEPDINGVNVVDGKKSVDMPVVLSAPADPRLTFDRVQNAAPYADGFISGGEEQYLGSSWSVHYGGQTSENFKCAYEDVCWGLQGTGSTIYFGGAVGSILRYQQAGTGAVYLFNIKHTSAPGGASGVTHEYRYASSVSYPDGEVLSYDYFLASTYGTPVRRPTKVTSTTGYHIDISYDSSAAPGTNRWGQPAEAKLFSPSGALVRRVTYGADGSITDYGDNSGGSRTFSTNSLLNQMGVYLETHIASIKLPTESSNALQIAGSNSHGSATDPLIDTITRDGVVWTYSYLNARRDQTSVVPPASVLRYDSLTVAGPNRYHVSYATFPNSYFGVAKNNRNLIQSRTEQIDATHTRTTNFLYDLGAGDRLTRITYPEGNSVEIAYDDYGNIWRKTTHAKPGSGLSDLIETQTVATGCEANFPTQQFYNVLCYRPITHVDALLRQTDFVYNGLGQLTQQLDPAVSGVRRQTDITYAPSGSGISRKTRVRVCGQSTTCSGSAESRTDFTYFASGDLANSILPQKVTVTDEATGAARVTTYTYDAAGRPTVVDGPLTGTGDAKYFRYDWLGRKQWEIGELGPNNLRLAKKYSYRDSDDKVRSVQSGTVVCTSGCDTAALTFTLLQQTDTTYDSRRYPIRETTCDPNGAIDCQSAGGAVYAVTDRSFLDRGLEDCTTVRMNFGALPTPTSTSACSPGTQGSEGADRITNNTYDSAGQLSKVQKAYLTSDQADYATYAYTLNGKQQYVTDANGSKAQFTYDGFDRLLKWNFPDKVTKGSVASTDYEQYAYDAAGNRTCLRKRDGSKLTFTFDNLNRMSSKAVAATTGGVCP